MSAFTLDPKPTFKLTVRIPVPGGAYEPVEFTCKYRTRSQFQSFLDEVDEMDPVGVIKSIVEGWSISEPCNEANIKKLAENYIGAAPAIFQAYVDDLVKAREKN